MPAGRLELGALVRDLPEEPGVLDGQGGLGGEGLQDVDYLRGKLTRLLPVEGQTADDLILAEQGHGEEGPVPEPDEGVPDESLFTLRIQTALALRDLGSITWRGKNNGRYELLRA